MRLYIRSKKTNRPRNEDLSGQSFGAIHPLERYYKEGGEEFYRCRCDACGGEAHYSRKALIHSPNRKSCGCGVFRMYPGRVVNEIEALLPVEGSESWYCRCLVCGEMITLTAWQFRNSFEFEGCAECRSKERAKQKAAAPKKQRKAAAAPEPVPPQSRGPDLRGKSIKEVQAAARNRHMSYGEIGAYCRAVQVGSAPKHYSSYKERINNEEKKDQRQDMRSDDTAGDGRDVSDGRGC